MLFDQRTLKFDWLTVWLVSTGKFRSLWLCAIGINHFRLIGLDGFFRVILRKKEVFGYNGWSTFSTGIKLGWNDWKSMDSSRCCLSGFLNVGRGLQLLLLSLISETFDSGDVCFYTFIGLVRTVLPSSCRRWKTTKFSNQQIKWKRVMSNLSMFGEPRKVVSHWSVKITSLDFSCESSVCWIPLQDDFQRVGIYGKQKKVPQNICSFVYDLSKQSQPVSTRRRRWKTHGRCYAFNQAFLHYPCNRTAYNISMSKKDLAW